MLIRPLKNTLAMIFNPHLTREAISGMEVTPEQLKVFDKQNFTEVDLEEDPPQPASSPRSPVKRKRSRFAIGTPEKVLEEARLRAEEGERKVGRRRGGRGRK